MNYITRVYTHCCTSDCTNATKLSLNNSGEWYNLMSLWLICRLWPLPPSVTPSKHLQIKTWMMNPLRVLLRHSRNNLPHSNVFRWSSSTAVRPPVDFDLDQFTQEFLAEIHDVPEASDPAKSAAILRRLVRSSVLKFTDMEESPEKFFLAHRLLSTVGLGGFGIRFTVQFNLFAGSIVGLAGPEQRKMLSEIQEKGQLGCFLLTEMQAGVLSGLIVETTADWDSATQEFVLHTPSDKAAKNWISQGYTAELGVVIADLRVDGVSHGPHPFFLQLRDGEGANGAFGCVWLRLLGQLFWDLSFVLFFSFPIVFLFPFPFPFSLFPFPLFIHSRHASLDRWVVDAGHSHRRHGYKNNRKRFRQCSCVV